MADCLHQIRINADAPRIYQALTSTSHLNQWWSQTADCPHEEGALCRLEFDASQPALALRAKKLLPYQRIYWVCEHGPQEWEGTEIWFEISGSEAHSCDVSLKHMGWHTDTAGFASSNTRWGILMQQLKDYCETWPGSAEGRIPPITP